MSKGDTNSIDCSSDELEDLQSLYFPGDVDWSSTLVLRCDPSAGPYNLSDLMNGLHTLVRRNEVYNIGQTCLNHVFTISFRTSFSLEMFLKFMQGGGPNSKRPQKFLKVKGKLVTLTRVPSECVTVTVRNIPLEIDSSHIVKQLSNYGTVVKTDLVKSNARGWFHVYTNERKITLLLKKDISPQDLPYGLEVKGLFASVHVEERNPKCLECYHAGHKDAICDSPKCILYEPQAQS